MRGYIVVIFLSVVLIRASAWFLPLARDAAAYAYVGRALAHRAVLYRDVWDHKPPGVYVLDAIVFWLFPSNYIAALRLASLASSLAASFLLFALLRRSVSQYAAVVATVLFSIFSNVYWVTMGDNLIEGYMVPILIVVYVSFDRALRRNSRIWYIGTGGAIGVLVLFKQVGILPLGAVAAYLFLRKKRRFLLPLAWVLMGIFLPLAPFFWYVMHHHSFWETWDAVIGYNMGYVLHFPDIHTLGQWGYYTIGVCLAALLYWTLVIVGALVRRPGRGDLLFSLFFLSALVGVTMGGEFAFTRHYFLLLFPAASFYVAKAIDTLRASGSRRMVQTVWWVGSGALFLPSLLLQGQVLFAGLSWAGIANFEKRESQYLVGPSLSNFLVQQTSYRSIASHIKTMIAPGERMLDWGAEPELYLATNTTSPTRYFYNFPLNGTFVKNDPLLSARRNVFMDELVHDKPRVIVLNEEEVSHQPSFQSLDFPQWKDFLARFYRVDTKIDQFLILKRI